MAILNHTIVGARDAVASARFLTDILGLDPPSTMGHFEVVTVGDTSLDFLTIEGELSSQHYAFLVSESEFDQIFKRIKGRGLPYWADPYRRQPGQINTRDDGRGVYWPDPDGHLYEILTRPYGSGSPTSCPPGPGGSSLIRTSGIRSRDVNAGEGYRVFVAPAL